MSESIATLLQCSYRGNSLVVTQLFSNKVRCGDIDIHHAAISDLFLRRRSIKKTFRKKFNSIKDCLGFMCRWSVSAINSDARIFTTFRKRLAKLEKLGKTTSRFLPCPETTQHGSQDPHLLPKQAPARRKPGIYSAVPPPDLGDPRLLVSLRDLILQDRVLHGLYEYLKPSEDKTLLYECLREKLFGQSIVSSVPDIKLALDKLDIPKLNIKIWHIFLTNSQKSLFESLTGASPTALLSLDSKCPPKPIIKIPSPEKSDDTLEHWLDPQIFSPIGLIFVSLFIKLIRAVKVLFRLTPPNYKICRENWWPVVTHLDRADKLSLCKISSYIFGEPLTLLDLEELIGSTVKLKKSELHYHEFTMLRNRTLLEAELY